MTDYNVTPANFGSTFTSAVGGDRLILASGNYGNFTFYSKNFSPSITIEAATRYGAVFTGISSSGDCSGFNFVGLDMGNNPDFHTPGGCTNISFDFCKSTGYFTIDSSVNTIYRRSYHQGRMGLSDVTTALFDESCIHYFAGDAVDFYRSSGVTVQNSVFYDAWAPSDAGNDVHPDGMQGLNCTDVIIRGNIVIDDYTTVINPANPRDLQGIFMGDGPHMNVEITENMVSCLNANGIRATGFNGTSFIRNNSLISTQIVVNATRMASLPVENNIALGISDEDGAANMALSNNFAYGGTIGDAYVDANGLDWTKFETVPAHSTKGAATRYAEILAGTNVEAINLAILNGISFTAPGGGGGTAPVAISPTMTNQSFQEFTGPQTFDASSNFTGTGITYSINAITGASINSGSGIITFNTGLMDVQAGTTITVTATNATSPPATATLEVTITANTLVGTRINASVLPLV